MYFADEYAQLRRNLAQTGLIYLVYSPEEKHYKIGRTVDIKRRCREIKKKYNLNELQQAATFKSTNTKSLETLLHKHFQKYCVKEKGKEWFSFDKPKAVEVKQLFNRWENLSTATSVRHLFDPSAPSFKNSQGYPDDAQINQHILKHFQYEDGDSYPEDLIVEKFMKQVIKKMKESTTDLLEGL